MSKRGAEKYLTDQNYNDDDAEDEEQSGSFQQASAAALATREIKKAKRRVTEQGSSPASGGAFQGFTGLAGVGGSQPAAPLFKFGADANKPFTAIASMTSSASSTTVTSAPSNSTQSMSFVAPSANAFGFGQSSARFAPSTASSVVTSASPVSSTSTASSNGQKSSSVATYRSELKMLNESVLTWIDQHVRSNPHCILSPIFIDYNRYVEELDRKYPNVDETTSSNGTASTVTSPVSTTSASSAATATVSANLSTAVSSSSAVSTVAGGGFQFGATKSTSLFSSAGTFGSAGGFGSSGTFGSFGSSSASKSSDVASSASGSTEATATEGDDDEYIPPKPEVVEIKEDDAFYTVKCKLFYQKDKSWQDRGVGNLYLKPCSEGKTQLLVRADTNLGNILLNIMLSASIPTSRQGANNVSFACIPNPPIPGLSTTSTPVPMLIRVKASSDADALFEQLNSHKQ